MLKWDGHTHTSFCKHGSSASMMDYVQRAIQHQFQRYTLTEHPPLPQHYIADQALQRTLAMPEQELGTYFAQAQSLKQHVEEQIEITVGLELDYLPDRPEHANRLLEQWAGQMEDAVVSVHFLPGPDGNECVDYTADVLLDRLVPYYGSLDQLLHAYYDQVEQAILWAGTLPLRTRIGHINLIEKFRLRMPQLNPLLMQKRLEQLLPLLQRSGVGVDVNTAGLRKPLCQQAYVPPWFIAACVQRHIPLVYGSDAHHPDEVGAGWDWFAHHITKAGEQGA
ncbi:histidinol-phosphatase HisJ [Paenibacillus wenxiniae]|uniref:Histidinol-phosphatase n=1 Tax=Paenibacillus wenxiniae TaxID=1636843 RepID=A0ABW4RI26_9BACL